MSRAFVKEPDGDVLADDLPDRTISEYRNLVTPSGLRMIEAALADWRGKESRLPAEDLLGRARVARELRYWMARRASAEVIAPPVDPEEVVFATCVTIKHEDGRVQTLALVGEDESSPEEGKIAWTAPLAHALIGLAEGEVAQFRDERLEIVTITSIE